MDDTLERLGILLDYWIEHNNEHEKEFRVWADRIASSSSEAAGWLQDAANKMAEVSRDLLKGRQALQKSREKH